MIGINNNILCGCKQYPRRIWEHYGVCRCAHLIYVPENQLGPPQPWLRWTGITDPAGRVRLIAAAKAHIGVVPTVDPDAVRDAVSAARSIQDNVLANDIEYEQWVASL